MFVPAAGTAPVPKRLGVFGVGAPVDAAGAPNIFVVVELAGLPKRPPVAGAVPNGAPALL